MRERLRTPRGRGLLAAGLLLGAMLLATLYWYVGWLRVDRGALVSTPVAFSRGEPVRVPVPAGDEACADSLALSPETQVAVVRLYAPRGRPVPPVQVTARGEGYEGRGVARGYRRGSDVFVPLSPPPGRELLAELCVRPQRGAVAVAATQDPRLMGRSRATVGGRPIDADISVTFFEARGSGYGERWGDMLDRMAVWKPAIFGVPFLWLVSVLVALVIPFGLAFAYGRTVAEDDELP